MRYPNQLSNYESKESLSFRFFLFNIHKFRFQIHVGPHVCLVCLKTRKYLDVLPKLVETYNATLHRSLNNIAPKDVNETNETDVWAYMYLKPKFVNVKKKKTKRKRLFRLFSGFITLRYLYNYHCLYCSIESLYIISLIHSHVMIDVSIF
jgi:hypothetical protein